jgi:hypothetical protein
MQAGPHRCDYPLFGEGEKWVISPIGRKNERMAKKWRITGIGGFSSKVFIQYFIPESESSRLYP